MNVLETQLLSREDFDRLVKLRSHGMCVACAKPAVDSHHVLDRKLFHDGGYYLGNGAALCAQHHLDAEATTLSVNAVRALAGIKTPVLPPGFSPDLTYDKWGNEVVNEHIIIEGPLAHDTGCRRALQLGRKLHLLYTERP